MVKNPPVSAGDAGDPGLIPGGEDALEEGGHGNPQQYSCLGNSMDREPGGLRCSGVAKSRTRLESLSTHTAQAREVDIRIHRHHAN